MKKTGIELIAEERQRQIEKEGFSIRKDKRYKASELVLAAMGYLNAEFMRKKINDLVFWPSNWSFDWYKPTPENRIRELQKAGALIAAEIDRLQALENKEVK